MREIRQGEVYWIDFGARRGAAPAESHPCVVVQSDVYNKSFIATTVVCWITSNTTRASAPGNVALQAGAANLPRPSVVNVSQLSTVDKTELGERIGKLSAKDLEAVRDGLYLLFDRV